MAINLHLDMKANVGRRGFEIAALVTISAIVCIIWVNRQGPFYRGRSLDQWFIAKDSKEAVTAFRQVGRSAFPFLAQKLNGTMTQRTKACRIIEQAFERADVDNSELKVKLQFLLKSGRQSEQIAAYEVIRHLALSVPDSEIAMAAAKCRSVKASESDFTTALKLSPLKTMTNSLDCAVISQLCKDSDPRVQTELLIFLIRTADDEWKMRGINCNEEISSALALIMQSKTNASVLQAALAYVCSTPERMRNNLDAICDLLDSTTSPELKMNCLGILRVAGVSGRLPERAVKSIHSLMSGVDVDPKVRQWAMEVSRCCAASSLRESESKGNQL